MNGVFITIEGGEGVGKSTQSLLLAGRLRLAGATVLQTREPGGTPVGDRVRELLLDPAAVMDARTELFLYEASRAELTARVIAPALERGEAVICDRFYDSTTAYQSFGRGIGAHAVRDLNLAATVGLVPDVTVLLMLDLDEAMRRATAGGADRIEGEGLDFHRRVIEGFEAIAAAEPERFVRVDASGDPAEVGERVWEALFVHPAVARFIAAIGLP